MSKPGCFGHVATCDPKSAVCANCEHLRLCAESAHERRGKLEDLLKYQRAAQGRRALKT